MASALPLLGLAAAAALVLSSKKSSASGASALPVNPDPKYDANLPAILESTVDQELLNDTDPSELRRFADSLTIQGYPKAAAALNARATGLEQPVPQPAPPIQPAPPPPVVTPPAPPTVVIAPITITPTTGQEFGVDATPYDGALGYPFVNYGGGFSGDATAVQNGLNLWAMATQFDPNGSSGYYPLTSDGVYGNDTASLAAAFQRWINATKARDYAGIGIGYSALAEDGIAGPATMTYLQPWATLAAGGTVP